MSTNG